MVRPQACSQCSHEPRRRFAIVTSWQKPCRRGKADSIAKSSISACWSLPSIWWSYNSLIFLNGGEATACHHWPYQKPICLWHCFTILVCSTGAPEFSEEVVNSVFILDSAGRERVLLKDIVNRLGARKAEDLKSQAEQLLFVIKTSNKPTSSSVLKRYTSCVRISQMSSSQLWC